MGVEVEVEVEIVGEEGPFGITRLELIREGRVVSRLSIVPFTLRVGAATVRMDGIGGVGTEEEHRHRGHARRLLEAAVGRMRAGDAALSMLYGIPHFYPRFGYVTAGPDHALHLPVPEGPAPPLPVQWRVRLFEKSDLPCVRELYDGATRGTVGTAVRAEGGRVWTRLVDAAGAGADECRVLEDAGGRVAAYVWRGRSFWYVARLEREEPGALVLAEAAAATPAAADALLDACQAWAVEESAARPTPVHTLRLALPPERVLAVAAMRRGARFSQQYEPCGESMARVLDVRRLLGALQPELAARWQVGGPRLQGTLRIVTDLGTAALVCRGDEVTVTEELAGAAAEPSREIHLPQGDLARLALGAYPPGDLLDRLAEPPSLETRELVEILFPQRNPHMYLPDRY